MGTSRPVRAVATMALLAASTSAMAGCGAADGAQDVLDQGRIVDELTSRVDEGTTRDFTAEYQVGEGVPVTVAHAAEPVRDAYIFDGGRYVTTPEFAMTCLAGECVLADPPAVNAPLDTEAVAKAGGAGFIPVQTVLGLLTQAALDDSAGLTQSDMTLAGEHANCVSVTGLAGAEASAFDACVTDSGVLGSFSGVVDGETVKVTLVSYEETAADADFETPQDATVADERE